MSGTSITLCAVKNGSETLYIDIKRKKYIEAITKRDEDNTVFCHKIRSERRHGNMRNKKLYYLNLTKRRFIIL